MWDNLPQGPSGVLTAKSVHLSPIKEVMWQPPRPSPRYPMLGTTSYNAAVHHNPAEVKDTQRKCSTFIKHQTFKFRIATWRQIKAVRLDWKLLSLVDRDNEQCHACKFSLCLGERQPALSIRALIIKIVVGPISGDVFPWIVNASFRHFNSCPIALKLTLKDTAGKDVPFKCVPRS